MSGFHETILYDFFHKHNYVLVSTLSDLPEPDISGIITLDPNKTYRFTTNVDLYGNRLVTSGITTILGYSSETPSLTSTGLSSDIPMLTSEYKTIIERITFKDVSTCVYITEPPGNTVALIWENVNFRNIPIIGTISSCDNLVLNTCEFIKSTGLTFTGTIGTIAVNNSLFIGSGDPTDIIHIDANANIMRRFRTNYVSFIVPGSTIGINVDVSSTIPTEGYILDTVIFSGNGTFLSGILVDDNRTNFMNCVGITNTSVNGQMYMCDNETITTIPNTTDFIKISGDTLASEQNVKYTMTSNRLTNQAVIQRKYLVQAHLSFNSTNGNICEFGLYDSTLSGDTGGICTASTTKATANAAGRAENVSSVCVINHSIDDYVEVHCRNTTSTNDITVTDMNVIITETR